MWSLLKRKFLRETFSHYVVYWESGCFVMLPSLHIEHIHPSLRPGMVSHLPKIHCLCMRDRERLRWLVPLQNLFSILVMTYKVLSLNTTDDVGSEEVCTCFSCLKLCSIVLSFYKPEIPNSLWISQIFHITLILLVTFSAVCLAFAELEEFPLHTPVVISC